MIRVVFFDVGGTLIAPKPSVGAIYAEIAAKHGVHADANALEQRFREQFKGRNPVKTATKEGWREIVSNVFSNESIRDPQTMFEELFEAFRDPARWSVFDDVRPTLDALKQKKIRLAIVSNWDERLPPLLDDLGLAPYFEQMFISFKVGVAKPDPTIFLQAIIAMNVDPIEAFHVGDHEVEDVDAAQKAGMRAYLIDRKRKPKNSRELVSLTEVLHRI